MGWTDRWARPVMCVLRRPHKKYVSHCYLWSIPFSWPMCLDWWDLLECCRHDIEKLTNEIVNKTTSDLRQLSSVTAQTPDNRVSPWIFHLLRWKSTFSYKSWLLWVICVFTILFTRHLMPSSNGREAPFSTCCSTWSLFVGFKLEMCALNYIFHPWYWAWAVSKARVWLPMSLCCI